QLPRRLTAVAGFGFHFAEQKTIGAARVARAGQALVLHHFETELAPLAGAGLERDDIRVAIGIHAARDDESVARSGVGVETAVEIEVAHHRFLVVDGQRRAAERARRD